jgi:hypothetical protein
VRAVSAKFVDWLVLFVGSLAFLVVPVVGMVTAMWVVNMIGLGLMTTPAAVLGFFGGAFLVGIGMYRWRNRGTN